MEAKKELKNLNNSYDKELKNEIKNPKELLRMNIYIT